MSQQLYNDINAPYGADIIFWGIDVTRNDVKKDEGDKVRLFDVHPINPWVLNIDRDDEIYVWDFSKNQCLFHKSLNQLSSINDHQNSRPVSLTNPLDFNDKYIKESILDKKRYDAVSSSNHHLYKYSSSIFDDLILGSSIKKTLFPSDICINNQHNNHIKNITAKEINVKSVKFIDESCLNNDTLNNVLYNPPTFHSSAHVMIVCDTCIIFHKFLSSLTPSSSTYNSTKIITINDLNNKNPTSAEFIFNSICAIGCSDGIIRIWDCLKWCEIKQLSGHSKGDVLSIKSLPVLR